MGRRVRRREFRPAGAVSPRRLGFPARRARLLELVSAWERAAGPAIAGRARPEGVRRGELELVVADPAWAATLQDLLPRLLARLAVELPGVAIDRGHLVVPGEAAPRATRRAAPAPGPAAVPGRRTPTAAAGVPDPERPVDDERLRRAMDRYLERAIRRP